MMVLHIVRVPRDADGPATMAAFLGSTGER